MVTPAGDRTTIDAGAEKRFFIEMLTKDIELLPAIVDLVDNSVDGARSLHADGDLTGQWVKITTVDDRFMIEDNSGGIEVDVARHYAFRFGRSKDFAGVKRSVGQFGVGMKRAIFKIGGRFSVDSVHRGDEGASNGSRFSMRVDVDEWSRQDAWTFEFDSVEENISVSANETSGTTLVVRPVHLSVADDFNDPSVQRQLSTELRVRHQQSIQSGLKIYVNSEKPLTAARPSLQASDVIQPIVRAFPVSTERGQVDVTLYAGTVAPSGRDKATDLDDEQAENFQDPGDAGWYLFCNDRLLLAADRSQLTGWGSPAAAYHPQYRLFRGFVYLSADDASLLPWNTTKTAVDRDSAVFRAVQSEMKVALVDVQAMINRVKNVRARVEEDDDNAPDLLVAVDAAPDTPLQNLATSAKMVAPASPPPKTKAPVGPKTQRIQYTVDLDKFEEVSQVLEAGSGSEVGRLTFDYFYSREVD